MRIRLESVPVTDQGSALRFYTEKLGFKIGRDVPMGAARFLTVVSPEDPDGAELMLEPNGEHAATKAYKAALYAEGIPVTAFQVEDVKAEHERLVALGVEFKVGPTAMGTEVYAVLDDTCGNWISIYQDSGRP